MNVFVLFRFHCSCIVHCLFAWTVCYSVEVYGVTATTVRNGCKLKLDFAEASVGSCWHCSRANSSLFTWVTRLNFVSALVTKTQIVSHFLISTFSISLLFCMQTHSFVLVLFFFFFFFLSRKHNKLRVRVHQRASMWRHGRYLAAVLLVILDFKCHGLKTQSRFDLWRNLQIDSTLTKEKPQHWLN